MKKKPTLPLDTLKRIGQCLRWYYDLNLTSEPSAAITLAMMKLKALDGGGKK